MVIPCPCGPINCSRDGFAFLQRRLVSRVDRWQHAGPKGSVRGSPDQSNAFSKFAIAFQEFCIFNGKIVAHVLDDQAGFSQDVVKNRDLLDDCGNEYTRPS
jgi:hypothetical protein